MSITCIIKKKNKKSTSSTVQSQRRKNPQQLKRRESHSMLPLLDELANSQPVIDPHLPTLGYINESTAQKPYCGQIWQNIRPNPGGYVDPSWPPHPP